MTARATAPVEAREARWTGGTGPGTVQSMASQPAGRPTECPTVRPAEPGDEAVLGELDRRNWSTLHSVQPRPLAPYRSFFNALRPPAQFLVAELEAPGVVGYVRLAPPTTLQCNVHVRQIQGLVVDSCARRRGVARALLTAACDRAHRQGAVRITLRVLGHNRAARELYASEGFAVEGVLRGEFVLDGAYADDVLMGRWLADPAGEPHMPEGES